MTLEQFKLSLDGNSPPSQLSPALAGLWWDAKGDWERAHSSAMADKTNDGSWVHAYLHRKEGDKTNAAGWYSRAKKNFCQNSLEEEWLSIAQDLLSRS